MAKVSKSSVNYRPATGAERCGNCSMFRDGSCTLVEGEIRPSDYCDRWEKMPSSSPKQARMMAGAAHDKKFAKKVGVPQAVAKEFNAADAKTGILRKKKK
jgi:hypothetical protein